MIARRRELRGAFVGILVVLAFALGGLSPCRSASATRRSAEAADTKATMARVLDAAAVLLPLSYVEGSFGDAANTTTIQDSLRALSAHTDHLAKIGASRDAGFAALAKSISREVTAAERDFLLARTEEAQDRVSVLTDHCVACHSRLPSDVDSTLGRRLLDRVDVGELGLQKRAQLETVTRQFNSALTTYEELLEQDEETKRGVMQLWNITAYLVLAVRVVGDLERPKPILKKLVETETLPQFVRKDIQGWLDALGEIGARSQPKGDAATLAEARALIAEARARSEFPYDRAGLIHYTRASALLLGYVDRNRSPSPELGEAYYLLGTCEAHTGRSSWLSSPELYLETAIRAAPNAPFAEKALSLLEWYSAVEFTGSGGTFIPEDVQTSLDELRDLVRHGGSL